VFLKICEENIILYALNIYKYYKPIIKMDERSSEPNREVVVRGSVMNDYCAKLGYAFLGGYAPDQEYSMDARLIKDIEHHIEQLAERLNPRLPELRKGLSGKELSSFITQTTDYHLEVRHTPQLSWKRYLEVLKVMEQTIKESSASKLQRAYAHMQVRFAKALGYFDASVASFAEAAS
jgi:hypothetical protein